MSSPTDGIRVTNLMKKYGESAESADLKRPMGVMPETLGLFDPLYAGSAGTKRQDRTQSL